MVVAGGGYNYGLVSYNAYAANSAVVSYEHCETPTLIGDWMRLHRSLGDGNMQEHVYPGACQRFRSNAPKVQLRLRANGLNTRTDARNFKTAVYVNGVFKQYVETPFAVNVVGEFRPVIDMGTSADRLYEIYLAYGDSLEFGGPIVDKPYVCTAATPLTGDKVGVLGDSISQGFSATAIDKIWFWLLCQARGWRGYNYGYGGRVISTGDGTGIVNLGLDKIIIFPMINEFLSQVPLLTAKNNLKACFAEIHAVNPTIPVYVAAMVPSPISLTIPASDYRNIPGTAIAEMGYGQLVGINATGSFDPAYDLAGDQVHPIDLGMSHLYSGFNASI